MHGILPFLLAMLAAIVLLEMLATKLRVAYPIVLVVAGLLLSFIPGLPTIKVNPDLIFFIFLPPLLAEAAWNISFKEMKKWYRIIGSFAFLVVLFTALAVAVVANKYIPGFSIALGFLLGGIVSPPDAVSTSAITKFVKIPKSTSTILEGESLLNDASSLIIFRFALVAIGTGQLIWQQAALSFLWMIVGGSGVGLLLGWFFVKMHRILPTDASSDIAFTIIEPYLMYWVGEEIHASGVLAVVACSLYMSNRNLVFLNSASRIMGYNVWEAFIFILNGIVFLIIGLELPQIVEGIRSEGIQLRTAIWIWGAGNRCAGPGQNNQRLHSYAGYFNFPAQRDAPHRIEENDNYYFHYFWDGPACGAWYRSLLHWPFPLHWQTEKISRTEISFCLLLSS